MGWFKVPKGTHLLSNTQNSIFLCPAHSSWDSWAGSTVLGTLLRLQPSSRGRVLPLTLPPSNPAPHEPQLHPQATATAGPAASCSLSSLQEEFHLNFGCSASPGIPVNVGGLAHIFLLTKWTFWFLHLSIHFAKGGQFNPVADPRNSLACSRQRKESLNEAPNYKDWIWDQCLRLIASCLIIYTTGTQQVLPYMDGIKMRQDSSQTKPSRISLPVQGWVGELFLQGKITF